VRFSRFFAAAFFGEVNELTARVATGSASSQLGPIPTPGLADGTEVRILIRPEALSLSIPVEGASAPLTGRVEAARLLGRTSLVHLTLLPNGKTESLHLHCRMPGQFLPPEGSTVGIALDLRQVFVFQADRS